MNSRERVIKALDHKEPDRVPLDFGDYVANIMFDAYVSLKKYLGLEWKGETADWLGLTSTIDEYILNFFKIDFRRVTPEGLTPEEWGIKTEKVGYYTELHVNPPLRDSESISDLDSYPWPPTDKFPQMVEGLEKQARNLEKQGWAVVAPMVFGGIMEMAGWWFRGFEKFIQDFYLRPRFACTLLDKILDVQLSYFQEYMSEVGDHIQIVSGLCEDLGMQNNLLISPQIYREYIKPRHKRIIDVIRQRTDAKILMHNDGAIRPIIGDLIDIGVDILNPIQPLAKGMDSKTIKHIFGQEICFHGAVDVQKILPFGSPDMVAEEVHKRIKDLAAGGGYILAPAHNIQPDVPPENLVEMYRAAYKFGRYPIS